MNDQNLASLTDTHNIEAEQALLGAVFINNDAMRSVDDFLLPEHFYEPINGKIFQISQDLIRAGKNASPVSLRNFIDATTVIGQMTLGQYLARLAAEATTIVNANDYGHLIYDLADRRRIAHLGAHLQIAAEADVAALAGMAIDELDAIVAKRSDTGSPAVTMRQAAVRAIDSTAAAYQRDGAISGLTWGLKDLDRKTLGMQRGEMIVLAGRPGMGKTAVALTVLRKAAETGLKGMMNSLEMGDISLTQRMISDLMHEMGYPLSYWRMRSGNMSAKDFEKMKDATERLALLPIKIEQQSGLTLSQIGARARQIKRKSGLDLLVVDHLHLIKPTGRYAGNRVNEIGEVTSGLKGLAKDLDVAVLALCQLSRGVEGRDDKRPNLGDLRGSGDIEQDADMVLMLYREAYYLERSKPAESDPHKFGEWLVKMEKAANLIEAIIEKQRNGPIGAVKLFCDIASNAVRDLVRDDAVQPNNQEALAL